MDIKKFLGEESYKALYIVCKRYGYILSEIKSGLSINLNKTVLEYKIHNALLFYKDMYGYFDYYHKSIDIEDRFISYNKCIEFLNKETENGTNDFLDIF